MEAFEIKGDNGFIKIEINEVFGFPNQICYYGGYECRANIEIKIPAYYAKGNFYTSTGEIFRFYQKLRKCQKEVKGEAIYLSYENNLELTITYNSLGQTEIYGSFHQTMGMDNCLTFGINGDQSFLKYTIEELEIIVKKYGNNQGIKDTENLNDKRE